MKEALIDTDILSFFFKGDIAVIRKVREYLKEHSKLNISIISKYEIIGGLEYKNARKQLEEFDQFLGMCEVVNLSDQSARISARAYGALRRRGITIGASDLLIAVALYPPSIPAILLQYLVVRPVQAFFADGSHSIPYSKEALPASFDPCPAVGQGLWFVYEQAFWHREVVQG